jgi:hypothetical protein
VASHLESAAGGVLGLLVAPVGTLMSSKPEGFGGSRRVFRAGLRGMSTFGDSLSGEIFFA